jgi:uncharacterized coiled-coil protein SlyX
MSKTQSNFIIDDDIKALIKDLKNVLHVSSQSCVVETAIKTLAKNISEVDEMNKHLTKLTKRIEALRGVEI